MLRASWTTKLSSLSSVALERACWTSLQRASPTYQHVQSFTDPLPWLTFRLLVFLAPRGINAEVRDYFEHREKNPRGQRLYTSELPPQLMSAGWFFHVGFLNMVLTVQLWDGNNATPADFQRCLLESHITLAGPAVNRLFRQWWTQTVRITAATGLAAWGIFALVRRLNVGTPWAVAAVSIVLAVLSPWLALRAYSRRSLVNFARGVATKDLSDVGARTNYLSADGRGVIVVLKDESGAVCGSACMLIEERANGIINPTIGALGKGEGLITRVGVLPSHHGKGGGKLMVERLLSHAREQRLKRVLLATTSIQPVAVGLYAKRGFKIVNQVDKIPALDFSEYVMALDL
jgi:GNAT superfamily N-acetyltransferase